MIRVLICDDHQIVRQGIKQMLADASDLALAGEAASGPEAIARVREGGIDVVLLDIAMPQRDGLDVLRQLKSEVPKLPVLMLSTYPDRQYAVRSLKLGAAGYLNKSADSEQMTEAIRRVAAASAAIALPAWAQSSRIVLGQSAAFSGPAAQLGIQMNKGAKIFFDQLNAAGGVNGHTIELRTLESVPAMALFAVTSDNIANVKNERYEKKRARCGSSAM